ncbi:tannase-domain-containing protein [Aspergillus ellipticus CBS 707.79]|uniref:Carboxylic ester hydrolase n=1 Tax=Aspergillus ellipticus CBS 707.79 TaxID=1448320 RepID=A0A319F1K6_9EURO|nr:tannase-domain-containing protein [Aspergillus ellipticus CBS 707.79]
MPSIWKLATGLQLLTAMYAAVGAATTTNCCSAHLESAISIENDGKVLGLSANLVTGDQTFGQSVPDFCNVTVTYTHSNWNDTVHITAEDSWAQSLLSGLASNYSTGMTDTGHSLADQESASWAYKPDGELNLDLLEEYAYVALGDLPAVGKQLSNRYYGHGPQYSFWDGCSTGGRQGIQMAQKYPTAYNGIYAGSPAINFPEITM